MQTYRVPKHVHLCRSGDQVVFLDLKRDRYSAISNSHAALLRGVVIGWSDVLSTERQCGIENGSDVRTIVRRLVEKGLLTTNEIDGKAIRQVSIDSVTLDLQHEYMPTPSVGIEATRRFVASSVRALILLRARTLYNAVRSVSRSKANSVAKGNDAEILETIRDEVMVYQALRPFFFRGKDACLFDSLALFYFLLSHGVYATWVIGVHTGPFSAHSWLQHGNTVLNDRLYSVKRFTPILAI